MEFLAKILYEQRLKKESFENTLKDLGGEENINIFDVAADYTIHFPPSLWTELTDEQRQLAISKGLKVVEALVFCAKQLINFFSTQKQIERLI